MRSEESDEIVASSSNSKSSQQAESVIQNEIIDEDEFDDRAMLQSKDQKNRHVKAAKNKEDESLQAVKQPAAREEIKFDESPEVEEIDKFSGNAKPSGAALRHH